MRKIILFTIILLCGFSCKHKPRATIITESSLIDSIRTEVVNQDSIIESDKSSYFEDHIDDWYQNFSLVLEDLKKLIVEKKYQEAKSICESDSVQAIESLFDRWGDSVFFPEFSGLSEESSVKFRNNASEERIKLSQLKIDLYEKTMQNEKDSSFIRNYIFSLNQLAKYYYFDKNLEKASRVMNKAVNFVCKKEGEQSLPYATVVFNQAMLYKEMGDKATALKNFQKSKEIYEYIGMKGSEEWQNCVDLIQEIK